MSRLRRHRAPADDRLRTRVEADRGRVVVLEGQFAELQRDRAAEAARLGAAEALLPGISARRAICIAELTEATVTWQTARSAIQTGGEEIGITANGIPEAIADADAVTLLELNKAVEGEGARIRALLKTAADAETEAAGLSSEREAVRGDALSVDSDVSALRGKAENHNHRIVGLGTSREERQRSHSSVTARLDAALATSFPDWQHKVATQGNDFVASCRDLVAQWSWHRQSLTQVEASLSPLGAELQSVKATLQTAETAANEAEGRRAAKNAELAASETDRGEILEGRLVEMVRTEYRLRVEGAERALSEAAAKQSEAANFAVAAEHAVASARNALERETDSSHATEQVLLDKLNEVGITRGEAEIGVERGDSWVAAEAARLKILSDAVATEEATLADRRDALAAHCAIDRPMQASEQIDSDLAALEARRNEVSTELVTANAALHADEQVRLRLAEIKSQLETRRVGARVWNQLDELIGSADGAKFRRFAQSMTFSHLIRLANRHLNDLHPRYELQRAPSGELVLQVLDRDMADEVRGVHNLSGGERFLVSLALALGLATMSSSHGIRVESLLIDEGFGSLDRNSMAMAVSVLEQLQATGRRVAVISHLEELKERIAVKVQVVPVGGGRSILDVVMT